jgi:murein hydrolase activator
MTRILFLGLMIMLGLAVANTVRAEDGYAQRDSLGAVQKKLETEKKEKDALQKQIRSMESDIKSTKSKLVKTAASIQENEKSLKELEGRIAGLEAQKKELDRSLLEDRKSIARLTLALERLRRVPPEALIARPGAPLQAAQSALLMQEIMPALYHQAEKVRASLAELASVSEDLEGKRQKALETSKTLKGEHQELSILVDKRENLYAATTEDLQERKARVRRISAEASTLQDLVRRLDEGERREQQQKQVRKIVSAKPPRAGQARLPVSGIINTGYGDPDNFGAPSRGITIEGANEGLVVAPMGGIVRFAGPFKNYGQLIIVEHEKGYHSLIAGLKKIDTVVGQSVAAGEPLGLLNRASNGNKPTLYYELRLNGQPVNPAEKFTDLG